MLRIQIYNLVVEQREETKLYIFLKNSKACNVTAQNVLRLGIVGNNN